MFTVNQIRELVKEMYLENNFEKDKTGCDVIEILGLSFIADEDTIFGKVNEEYVQKELEWYISQSLNVYDIPNTPKIWQQVATEDGRINSNYGYLIFSEENGNQFKHVVQTLAKDKNSRRATMIYTRPSIQTEYNTDGMSDFICTNTVNYFIRNNKLHCVVQMRSNDMWAGYRNDYAWQKWVLNEVAAELNGMGAEIEVGDIIWNAASLHLYERQFGLVRKFIKTGEFQ